ncbi:MAG: diguanylate cyclase [Cyanobacteria bacterium J06621_15]
MKKLQISILKIVNAHFRYGVIRISNSTTEAITKVIKTIKDSTLSHIYFSGENSRLAKNIIQKYCSDSVFYIAEKDGNTETINKQLANFFIPFITRDLHMAIGMAIYKHQRPERLQQEKQHLGVIINSMGCGVIVTNKNTCIETINPVAERLTGWKKQEAIGKSLLEVFRIKDAETEEEIDNLAALAIRTGETLRLPDNCKLVAKDGSEISIGDTVSPVRDETEKILGAVLVFQDISQRKKTEAELIRNAFYDSITGLPNRVLFIDRLTQAFEHSKRRKNYCFGVLFLDLDGFKNINDQFGHGMGDKLLVDVSERLKSSLRGGDTVARFGGDEFAILLEDIKNVADATNVATRIQEELETPFDINERKILITASIGIALNRANHQEAMNVLDDADTAMYQAKEEGKSKYKLFVES